MIEAGNIFPVVLKQIARIVNQNTRWDGDWLIYFNPLTQDEEYLVEIPDEVEGYGEHLQCIFLHMAPDLVRAAEVAPIRAARAARKSERRPSLRVRLNAYKMKKGTYDPSAYRAPLHRQPGRGR